MNCVARICLIVCLFSMNYLFASTLHVNKNVPPFDTLNDAFITFQVEGAILRAKIFEDESIPLVSINAKTHQGIVTLTGQVPKQSCVHAILQEAQHIRGVQKIISHLKVTENSSKKTQITHGHTS